MLDKIKQTEQAYFNCFCITESHDSVTRYTDNNIKDMYSHNFSYFHDDVSDDQFLTAIKRELAHRKSEGKTYLKVLTHFPVTDALVNQMLIRPDIETYNYYGLNTDVFNTIKRRDLAQLKRADTPLVVEHGRMIDVCANYSFMTMEFAIRRIDRKFMVYSNADIPLNLYVCYENTEPVGNCELFLNENIAKIEDFDILDMHQKKGFGSFVLSKLLETSHNENADFAYLVTDHEDTAKSMYEKCGFNHIGQRTELMFHLK